MSPSVAATLELPELELGLGGDGAGVDVVGANCLAFGGSFVAGFSIRLLVWQGVIMELALIVFVFFDLCVRFLWCSVPLQKFVLLDAAGCGDELGFGVTEGDEGIEGFSEVLDWLSVRVPPLLPLILALSLSLPLLSCD